MYLIDLATEKVQLIEIYLNIENGIKFIFKKGWSYTVILSTILLIVADSIVYRINLHPILEITNQLIAYKIMSLKYRFDQSNILFDKSDNQVYIFGESTKFPQHYTVINFKIGDKIAKDIIISEKLLCKSMKISIVDGRKFLMLHIDENMSLNENVIIWEFKVKTQICSDKIIIASTEEVKSFISKGIVWKFLDAVDSIIILSNENIFYKLNKQTLLLEKMNDNIESFDAKNNELIGIKNNKIICMNKNQLHISFLKVDG